MKVTDLMVGDWVEYKGVYCQVAPADFMHTEWVNEIKPIPLTPELMEKNGFEELKGLWRQGDKRLFRINGVGYVKFYQGEVEFVDYVSDGGDYGYEDNYVCDVPYVHTLQHALNLFELETLGIKLIKDDEKEDDFWEQCSHCEFFEGYDMCLKKENFGSVTNESKAKCKRENLFKEKV